MANISGDKSPFIQTTGTSAPSSVENKDKTQTQQFSEANKGKMPPTLETKGHSAAELTKTKQQQGSTSNELNRPQTGQNYLGVAGRASEIRPQDTNTSTRRAPINASSPPPTVLTTAPPNIKPKAPNKALPPLPGHATQNNSSIEQNKKTPPPVPAKNLKPSYQQSVVQNRTTPPPVVPPRNLNRNPVPLTQNTGKGLSTTSLGSSKTPPPVPPRPKKQGSSKVEQGNTPQNQRIRPQGPPPVPPRSSAAPQSQHQAPVPSQAEAELPFKKTNPEFKNAILNANMTENHISEEKLKKVAEQVGVREKKTGARERDVYYSPKLGLLALSKNEFKKDEHILVPDLVLRNLIKKTDLSKAEKTKLLSITETPSLLNKISQAKFKKTQRAFYEEARQLNLKLESEPIKRTVEKRGIALKEFFSKANQLPLDKNKEKDLEELKVRELKNKTSEENLEKIMSDSTLSLDEKFMELGKANTGVMVSCSICNNILEKSEQESLKKINEQDIGEDEKAKSTDIIKENFKLLKKFTAAETEFVMSQSKEEIVNGIAQAIETINRVVSPKVR